MILIMVEQVVVGCLVAGYYFLTLPHDTVAPPVARTFRGRSCNRSDCDEPVSTVCAQKRKHHCMRVAALWVAAAASTFAYNVLARMNYERCQGSVFKVVLAMLNPGECATYTMYMNYIKAVGSIAVFGMIAQVWNFLEIDADSVMRAHMSIRQLNN
eukprot:gene19547-26229_t